MQTTHRVAWLIELPTAALRRFGALVLLPVLAGVVAADVIARYLLSSPIVGAQDISTLTLLIVFASAVPVATAARGHIRMETFYERYGPRTRAVVDLFGALSGAVFFALLAYWQFRELPGMRARGEGADLIDLPHWPFALYVGICSAYVVVLLLMQAVQDLASAFCGEGAP